MHNFYAFSPRNLVCFQTAYEGIGYSEIAVRQAANSMTRAELRELGYIVPIDTVPSILQHGILSHNRATKVAHQSIALENVQDRRASVVVPGGRTLHDYANLYICVHNPMLLKRSEIHEQICVLRISAEVIDLRNAVVTDSNAASKYCRFSQAPAGLAIVNRDRTFADWWNHPGDQIEQWRHSAQKCAEVLVPDFVAARYVAGAYVSCEHSRQHLHRIAPNLPITIDGNLFFQRGAA